MVVARRTAQVGKRIAEKRLELRSQIWPDLDEDQLWLRTKAKGFTTIPRTLPLVLRILDSLSRGRPLSSVYLDIWARAHDECVVQISNPRERAFYSGFSGQRAVLVWQDRMQRLVDLGFIDAKPGANGPFSYVLLVNPHLVIRRLRQAGEEEISDEHWNALTARLIEIGAQDFQGEGGGSDA